jgi:hypothetical protein
VTTPPPEWLDAYLTRKSTELMDGLAATGVVIYTNDQAEVWRMVRDLVAGVMAETAIHLSHTTPDTNTELPK